VAGQRSFVAGIFCLHWRLSQVGINERLRDEMTDKLFEAILSLENKEECYRFFEDIATIAEIKAMAQRLEVARLLKENVTYTAIAEATGASTATISRVKRCLFFGADGYQLVLSRLGRREGNPTVEKDKDKKQDDRGVL
jgi:TrpR-related protein YerC/YecD